MPGTIILYRDSRIEEKRNLKNRAFYSTPADRKRIIEYWRDMYGFEFEKMYFHIRPDTDLSARSAKHLKPALKKTHKVIE